MKKQINKPLPKEVKKHTKNLAKKLLLALFAFWTIGAILAMIAFSWLCIDNSKDSAMITASADSSFANSYSLNDYLSGTYVDDGAINIYNDDISFYANGVGYFQLTSSQDSSMENAYNTWYDIEINFATINGTQYTDNVMECQYLVGGGLISNLDSTYRLTRVFRSQYNGPYNTIISLSFFFENPTGLSLSFYLHLRTADESPFISIAPNTWEVAFDNDYISQLRGQINTLQQEVQTLQNTITTLRIDLEASESLRESEVTALNNTISNLQITITDKNNQIEELNARIRELTFSGQAIYDEGYSQGFQDGGNATAQQAWNEGYNAAVLDGSGGGNFRSMIGALIDVPVNAVTSLLDWNLLGINLKEFFFSIVSVLVIITIAKLFIG